MDLLSFAVSHCTPDMIEPVLRAKCLLETQVRIQASLYRQIRVICKFFCRNIMNVRNKIAAIEILKWSAHELFCKTVKKRLLDFLQIYPKIALQSSLITIFADTVYD